MSHQFHYKQLETAFGCPKKFKIYRKLLAHYLTSETTYFADCAREMMLEKLVEFDESRRTEQNAAAYDGRVGGSLVALHNRFIQSLLLMNDENGTNTSGKETTAHHDHSHHQQRRRARADDNRINDEVERGHESETSNANRNQNDGDDDDEDDEDDLSLTISIKRAKQILKKRRISSVGGRPLAQWIAQVCDLCGVHHFANSRQGRRLIIQDELLSNGLQVEADGCCAVADCRLAWMRMETLLMDVVRDCIRTRVSQKTM